ncbi:hypothetical protein EV2_047694 [Malus domestica]
MELGYRTLQDIMDQERFDGYHHNQFMVASLTISLLHHSLTQRFSREASFETPQNETDAAVVSIDQSFSRTSVDLITKGGKRNGLDSLGDSLPSPSFRLHLAFQLQWRSEDLRPLSLPLQHLILLEDLCWKPSYDSNLPSLAVAASKKMLVLV